MRFAGDSTGETSETVDGALPAEIPIQRALKIHPADHTGTRLQPHGPQWEMGPPFSCSVWRPRQAHLSTPVCSWTCLSHTPASKGCPIKDHSHLGHFWLPRTPSPRGAPFLESWHLILQRNTVEYSTAGRRTTRYICTDLCPAGEHAPPSLLRQLIDISISLRPQHCILHLHNNLLHLNSRAHPPKPTHTLVSHSTWPTGNPAPHYVGEQTRPERELADRR